LDVRPEFLEARISGPAERRHVVEQRIEPDVGDVLVVEGELDPPLEARLRPADRQILQWVPQEAEDLVAIPFRPDEVGVALDVVDEPRLILRHLEEVVLLLDPLEGPEVVRAFAVDDFLLGVEPLAAEAVVTAIRAEIDLARIPQLLEDCLDDLLVPALRRPDVVAVLDAEGAPRLAKRGGV